MALHKDLTEADLHENKGVSAATDNTVATASGGETVWQKITSSQIDTSSIFNTNKYTVTLTITDVSTAETVYFYVPYACTLNKVGTILQGTITGADSTITIKNNSGNTAGTITVAYSGSSAGDKDSVTPVSNNTFSAGHLLSVATDGASSTAAKLFITLVFTITG